MLHAGFTRSPYRICFVEINFVPSTMTMKRPIACLRVTALIACAALSCSRCHSLLNSSPLTKVPIFPAGSLRSTSLAMVARSKGGVPRKSASGIHVGVKKNDIKNKPNREARTSARTKTVSDKKPLSTNNEISVSNSRVISQGTSIGSKAAVKKSAQQRRRKIPPQYLSRYEMLQHEILTAEEEQTLGRRVQRSIRIKDRISEVVQEKQLRNQRQQLHRENDVRGPLDVSGLFGRGGSGSFGNDSRERDDLADFSFYGMGELRLMDLDRGGFHNIATESLMEVDNEMTWDAIQPTSHSIMNEVILTDEDVIHVIGVPGGRTELYQILLEGALARDKLIRSNIRLVMSIAKKWALLSAEGTATSQGNNLSSIYGGSSERPSLDEAIQEGILGLAVAADRFEPERELKFGTYATHWITSYIRKCFQGATTGCFRVPPNYHVVKQNYQKLVKKYYEADGASPPMESIADEMGLKPQRLRFILKSTEPLISIDAPFTAGKGPGIGGKAGGDAGDGNDLVLKHTLAW